MYKILEKKEITATSNLLKLHAPRIARKALPGNFVILQLTEKGERFVLTVVDTDIGDSSITIIAQVAGKSTALLCSMNIGDELFSVVGPLGNSTHIENFGTAVVIGGGVGIAETYPIAKALKEAGNKLITIIGGRDKSLLMLENELRAISDKLIVTTDNGSYGEQGLVTDPLKRLINNNEVDFVLCIGPIPMMAAVSEATRPNKIKTMVSLNPVMVDGTGMCGACRVNVGGKMRFACVEGPEFNGHEVDFKELANRNRIYLSQEKFAMDKFQKIKA